MKARQRADEANSITATFAQELAAAELLPAMMMMWRTGFREGWQALERQLSGLGGD